MERQRENPNTRRPYGDNASIDLIKDVGFKVMAFLGWLAWIPTALFLFVMLFMLYLAFFPWMANLVRWLGIDATVIIATFTIQFVKLVGAILALFGIHMNINYKKFSPSNLPFMMFGTIFDLFRPNRFTFLFFFVAIGVYIAVGMQYQ